MAESLDNTHAKARRVSAIVPTLNEERAIDETLAALRSSGVDEMIVVDGGSVDRTVQRAEASGARVVAGERGRGRQLATGARAAAGDILWFVHADTLTPTDGCAQIRTRLAAADCVGGHFEIRFAGESRAARLLTRLYRHLRLIGLRYGDSAFFVERGEYERAGGFRDLPIFEDLDLLRRLRRRGRFVRVPSVVTTSSRRFEGRSFALVFARWSALQVLYWVGVPATWLARAYAPVRAPGPTRRALSDERASSSAPSRATRASYPATPSEATERSR